MFKKELTKGRAKRLRRAHSHIRISPSSQWILYSGHKPQLCRTSSKKFFERDLSQKVGERVAAWKVIKTVGFVGCKSINLGNETYSYFQVQLLNKILNSSILSHRIKIKTITFLTRLHTSPNFALNILGKLGKLRFFLEKKSFGFPTFSREIQFLSNSCKFAKHLSKQDLEMKPKNLPLLLLL